MADISNEFKSDLITLHDVVNKHYFFNIPIYQRLYVWGQEQIHTLLDDIVQAFHEEKNEFYLGGTLVIERENSKNENGDSEYLFDLIDGQQRFTTLWLISVVLEEKLQDYKQVLTAEGIRPRIGFAIRPQVTEFFQKVCAGNIDISLPEALQLEDALQEIRAFFDNFKEKSNKELDKAKLSAFIRDKVLLILTRVPINTDLNKLFEVINNRGVQLQHHEILKAKMLELLAVEERESYGQLWDACSDMSGYVEKHLKTVTKIDVVSLFEHKIPFSILKREPLASATAVMNQLVQKQRSEESNSLSLEDILNEKTDFELDSEELEDKDGSELPDRVNSIISFSMLLQHVLRIYLTQQAHAFSHNDIGKISDKDLLNIFIRYFLNGEANAMHVKQYIQLLWEVRYLFDKHIIKWVIVEEDKVHAIRRPYINHNKRKETKYLQRLSTDAAPDFALLQSMLYHSQQMTTQYWLTPLLYFLLSNNEGDAELYLQHLDNNLLCSQADAPLIERTQRYLANLWHTEEIIEPATAFNQTFENGTQYPHYWFYKLEYVLYRKLKKANSRLVDNFRMTAKNSVEHVAPQHPERDKDKVSEDVLHRFGNLALVTRSLNSEMSNKGYGIKQAEFKSRYQGNGVCLKLESIYENKAWQKDEIETHQQDMIECFEGYLFDIKVKALEKAHSIN